MFICLAELLVIPWLTSWLMKACSGRQSALMMVFVWNLWVRETFPWTVRKSSVMDCGAGRVFSVTLQNRLFPASRPGALCPGSAHSGGSSDSSRKGHQGGCLTLWLTCFLGFFMCTCNSGITPPIACPIHEVKKTYLSSCIQVLNNRIWTSFPFAPYFSEKSE